MSYELVEPDAIRVTDAASELVGERYGATVSLIVVDTPPGHGPDLHGIRTRRFFVVHSGEADFTVGDEVVRAGRGQGRDRPRRHAARVQERRPRQRADGEHPRVAGGSSPSGSDDNRPGDPHRDRGDVPVAALRDLEDRLLAAVDEDRVVRVAHVARAARLYGDRL
jgi:hypothetical protein